MRLEAELIRITGGKNLPPTQKKKTLILNADYSPWNVKDSVESYKNYMLPGRDTGKPSGRAIDIYEEDPIRGASFFDEETRSTVQRVFPRPAVIVLNEHQSPSRRTIRVSRDNVFVRDNYVCQYCGRKVGYNLGDMEGPNGIMFSLKPTWDHVLPREKGGKSTFENTVCCCALCNTEKSNRLLRDARHSNGNRFQLLRQPIVPTFLPPVRFLSHVRDYNAKKWLPYIPEAEKYIEVVRLKPSIVLAIYSYYGIDKELPEHVLSYDGEDGEED